MPACSSAAPTPTHVLVLRDGMPLNDASDASGAFNFGVDTLADVERIEVIRGPMAALYGSGAIGGVINLISRRGHEPGFHVTGELAGGYPKQMEGNVNASGIEGPFDYSATLQGQAQRGYDATPQRMSIYTGVPDPFSELTGTLNLGYTPIDGTRLSLFLRARRAVFGFDALGNPDLRQQQLHRPRQQRCSAASASPRSCSTALTKPAPSSAGCRTTGITPRRSIRAIPTSRATTRATTATAPTCSGTTRCTCPT